VELFSSSGSLLCEEAVPASTPTPYLVELDIPADCAETGTYDSAAVFSFEAFTGCTGCFSGITISSIELVVPTSGSATGTVDIDNTCGATVGANPADTADFGTMEAGIDTGTDTIVVTNTGTQPASTLSVRALDSWLATSVTNSAAIVGDAIYGPGITSFGDTVAVPNTLTLASQAITASFIPGAFTTFWETSPGVPAPSDFRGNIAISLEFSVTCP